MVQSGIHNYLVIKISFILFFSIVLTPLCHSQKLNVDTLIEISNNRFCREFIGATLNGKKGLFFKSQYLQIVFKDHKFYLIKEVCLEDDLIFEVVSNLKFKPVEIINTDLAFLNKDSFLVVKNEQLLPFILIRKDDFGKQHADTIIQYHSCISYVEFHLPGMNFIKEVDSFLLSEFTVTSNRSSISIYKNTSWSHNKNLLLITIYDIVHQMADEITVEGGYALE